ncbi:flagellar basal body rod protein FlgB [Paenibacillus sp. WLX2291]|uniref:flagellar basal body rod protein FlgB n=1 Tax=Paenibacillus sp. WLX2291 TaxID=3296934 RepID=UPI003983F81D
MNLLNDASFRRLEGAISASNLRQQVITNNIANADTPYFKRSEVSFENLLQSQMDGSQSSISGITTNPRHFQIGSTAGSIPQASVVTDNSTVMNNNLNNVDMDVEMSDLAENQLRYNTYIEQVNHQIKMMRTAIQGGGA